MSSVQSPTGPVCTIQRSLEVLGPRWNLLILREAHNGVTRFADFRRILGVAPDVLSDRLHALVEAGVLEKRRYQEPGERARDDYHLTPRGEDLKVVLAALQQWGDVHAVSEAGPPVERRRRGDDEQVSLAFVDSHGELVPDEDVYFLRRPPNEPAPTD